jgi:hypothetical protein
MDRPDDYRPPQPPPPPPPQPSGAWLGVISAIVGLTLIAPPLSVLYDMNDELMRISTGGAGRGIWETLYVVPPLSVAWHTYLAPRTVAIAAAISAAVLCGIGLLTVRSRALGVRLLGAHAVAHVVLMLAMVLAAWRFAAALDVATAQRAWYLGQAYGSSVGRVAIWAALPGIAYPLVLLWLFARHRRGNRAIRPM